VGIAADAPRGGLVETLARAPRVLVLRNAEIERFEDRHNSIFVLWDGFFDRAPKPTTRQVRDLVALGLVGGGMLDKDADSLLADLGPAENQHLYTIAQGLIGVAFVPDVDDDDGDEDAGETSKKKPGDVAGKSG
jgi:hypothetical protein